jgi:hypothetical protein
MGYGYSRDYIIIHIFDGYNAKNLNDPNNETKEKFLTNAKIIKIPIDIDQHSNNKERLIAMIKDEEFFPLFIDVNHSLYHNQPIKVVSKEKMERFFKYFFLKKIKIN